MLVKMAILATTSVNLKPALTGEPTCTPELIRREQHSPWGVQCQIAGIWTWQGVIVVTILALAALVVAVLIIRRARGGR